MSLLDASTAPSDSSLEAQAPAALLESRPGAIVLVDDNLDVLIILQRLLHEQVPDHVVLAVTDGQAALRSFANHTVPLLITDYNMPGMNGSQLIQAVKRISPQTHTVLVTAYDSSDLRRNIRGTGVDTFLTKPFSLDRLEHIVREILAQRMPAPA